MFKLFFPFVFFILFFSGNLFSQQVETLTGPFSGSGGISVDASGILYVSNFGSGFGASDGTNLFKVFNDGNVEEFATGFDGGSGNAFDREGNLYQSNINANTISKVTPDGNVTLFADKNLSYPVGVAVDSKGNVFVANCGVNLKNEFVITKITPAGATSKFATSSLMNCPNGLTIDENDVLYSCNYNDGRVLEINTDGTVKLLATLPGGNNSHLAYANKALYVAKRCDNKIYKVDLDGSYELIAGTGERGNDDGNPFAATINLPNGLAVSPTGDTLYFSSKISFDGGCLDTPLNPVVIRMITGLNNATGTEEIKNIPLEFKLEQNYPNPFNPTTKIRYTIPFVGTHLPAGRQGPSAAVQLKVYNVLGNEVATLVNEEQAPGNYEIEFDAAAGSNKTYMPSGVYFYRFKAGKFSAVNKMILLK